MNQPSEAARLSQVANIWAQALDVDAVGPDDNFFALGGDSILVTVMVLQVEELFDTMVSADLVFDHPTLREFVAAVLPA
jgi:mycobactin phenyloxazoline synthetase